GQAHSWVVRIDERTERVTGRFHTSSLLEDPVAGFGCMWATQTHGYAPWRPELLAYPDEGRRPVTVARAWGPVVGGGSVWAMVGGEPTSFKGPPDLSVLRID